MAMTGSFLSVLFVHLIQLVSALPHYHSNAPIHPFNRRCNSTHLSPVDVVHDFPTGTWIENLAVRTNGQIIATEDIPRPRIYQVDPFGSRDPIVLHEFSDTASILGIAETIPDVFYVCSANYSSKTLQGFGEAYIFRVDMRSFAPDRPGSAEVSKIATLPEARALDGLDFLGGESNLLLVSDFLLGVVWSVNIGTGEVRLLINNSYTRSTGFGVNGLKIRDNHLYFTNTQQQTLVKVPVDSKGQAVGNYSVISYLGVDPDDFAIGSRGDFYVTSITEGNSGIVVVPVAGGSPKKIADIAGPTACAFGRTSKDKDVLYVSTSGGNYDYLSGKPVTVSGKVVRIKVRREAK